MSSLEQLYQQVILDHAREKHGHGLRDTPAGQASGESHQYNPLCGDEVTVRVSVSVEGPGARPGEVPGEDAAELASGPVVTDLSWSGEGCSISQAATSVLHDLVVGRPVCCALGVVGTYREMVRSRGRLEPDEEVLGDAVAFAGVGRHANRVKCAMLGWTAFEDALNRSGVASSTREGAAEEGEGEFR
jgi:nitrogen fixation protein NifU and related proteins